MTQIGSVYARALYDLAREEKLSEDILGQMKVLEETFAQNPDFLRLLSTPNISKEDRCQIVHDSFGQRLQPYVLNFLKILTEKGYIRYFADCCRAYRNFYNEDNGILPVGVVTSVPLTQEQAERLSAKLAQMTGKTIELHPTVDETCMGGVRLDYDGKRVDDTVRHRLEAVHRMLQNTVL